MSDAPTSSRPRREGGARIARASSEQRNRTARATSSVDTQPERSAVGIDRRFASVSMVPGSTAFTRTPLPRSSSAAVRTSERAAAFDAA